MANSSKNFTVAPMPDVASPLDLVKASIYVLAAQFQLFPYVIILWVSSLNLILIDEILGGGVQL